LEFKDIGSFARFVWVLQGKNQRLKTGGYGYVCNKVGGTVPEIKGRGVGIPPFLTPKP
jgi:hypothetical protein